jgi:hypothetical protein
MSSSEPEPISFDPLQSSVERSLQNACGSAVSVVKAELLTELNRLDQVWRCTLDADRTGASFPRTVIIKHAGSKGFDPGNTDAIDTQRFFGDWAGAQYLSQVCAEPHGPRFYGGDLQMGFIVLEDMGKHRSLVQPLLEGDRPAATRALLAYARRLGRMHAQTMGREAEYDAILRALNPAARQRSSEERNQQLNTLIDKAEAPLAGIGMELSPAVRSEMGHTYAVMYGPGPFRTFIHTDPCPDNMFYDGDALRLIDFEWARFGHALQDGLYCRVPFPTCWCSNRVPPEVVAQVEQAYRRELAVACPAALDDALFNDAVIDVTAFWGIDSLRWLEETLKEDNEWGIAGVRSRILTRLGTFLEVAEARLPALQALCGQMLDILSRRWPDVQPLPVYPAFREPAGK